MCDAIIYECTKNIKYERTHVLSDFNAQNVFTPNPFSILASLNDDDDNGNDNNDYGTSFISSSVNNKVNNTCMLENEHSDLKCNDNVTNNNSDCIDNDNNTDKKAPECVFSSCISRSQYKFLVHGSQTPNH